MKMNRIKFYYKQEHESMDGKGNVKTSILEIVDDLKGYTARPLLKLCGQEADLVYQLLQFIDWEKAKENGFMKYGDDSDISTTITEEEFERIYTVLYGSFDNYSSW